MCQNIHEIRRNNLISKFSFLPANNSTYILNSFIRVKVFIFFSSDFFNLSLFLFKFSLCWFYICIDQLFICTLSIIYRFRVRYENYLKLSISCIIFNFKFLNIFIRWIFYNICSKEKKYLKHRFL